MPHDHPSELRFTEFAPALADQYADSATASWFQVAEKAFHAPAFDDDHIAWLARNYSADRRLLHAVYDPHLPHRAWHAPVATLDSHTQTFAIPGPADYSGPPAATLINAHLISGVTVRPTHRRRGLLRELMSTSLKGAASQQAPVALLTASEGGIYRRFGFGPASYVRSVSVDTSSRFELLSTPAGRVDLIEPAVLAPLVSDVFAQFHSRQAGSVDRPAMYTDMVTGAVGEDGKADCAVRAAIHSDADGIVDGYVTYKHVAGATPSTLKIVDLVASTADAYLGLWEFLASIDLVERITHENAPVVDPLPAALADPRVVSVTGVSDLLWLRLLDPVALLRARSYGSDGRLAIRIDDRLGYADGVFEIDSSGSGSAVSQLDDHGSQLDDHGDWDIRCDAADFASMCIGTFSPATLASAGRLSATTRQAIDTATAMLRPGHRIYCMTGF